jgi:hypothetical protein
MFNYKRFNNIKRDVNLRKKDVTNNDILNIKRSINYTIHYSILISVILDYYDEEIIKYLNEFSNNFKTSSTLISINSDITKEDEERNEHYKTALLNKSQFDYFLILDKKIINNNINNIDLSFFNNNYYNIWDAIFANRLSFYDDIDNLYCNLTKSYHDEKNIEIKNKLRQQLKIHIPKNSNPINVKSAFGYFAIYKTTILNENNSFENILSFNMEISNRTDKMFIFPYLIV